MKSKILIVAIATLVGIQISAQLPVTKIYLAEIENQANNRWHIKKLKYLTAFNPASYNNQPIFISETKFLASSALHDLSDTDILEYDLLDNTYKRIIANRENDFSPRMHPVNQDEITCVHQKTDGDSAQVLLAYDRNSGQMKRNILVQQGKIGYYRYWENSKWITYLVDSIHMLAICDEKSGTKKIFATDIGRCFELVRPGFLLFVHKQSNEKWVLKEYEIKQERIRVLAEMPSGVEDFAIDSKGRILCAKGSTFYFLNQTSGSWDLLASLNDLIKSNIKRINILGNKVLFVTEN